MNLDEGKAKVQKLAQDKYIEMTKKWDLQDLKERKEKWHYHQ